MAVKAIPVGVLVAGEARGDVLRVDQPISFWGGVDPETGAICDPRQDTYGTRLSGRVLVLKQTVGSSSSSAIMLELLRRGIGPAAVLLGMVDPILTLGVVVGRELGYRTCPVAHGPPELLDRLPDGVTVLVEDGMVHMGPGSHA